MILLVKMADLFLVRHHTGRFLTRSHPEDRGMISWSVRLLQYAASQYQMVVIFYDTVKERGSNWPDESIRDVIKSLGLQHVIEVVEFSSLSSLQAMETWKRCIINLGGKWDQPINHNKINYMNIDTVVNNDDWVWVGAGGNQELGINPDKVTSFMDLARERESKAIW